MMLHERPAIRTSLVLVALALAAGCKNSDDGGGSGQSAPAAFGEGPLPQQFGVFLARDLNSGEQRLSMLDATTGELRDLASGSNGLLSAQGFGGQTTVIAPVLSPDGRVVALTALDGSTIEARLVATADGRSIVLESGTVVPEAAGGGFDANQFAFCDDSSWLLMRTGFAGQGGAALVRRNGSGRRDIDINGEPPYRAAWIPGTCSLAAVGENAQGTASVVRVIEADSGSFSDLSLGPDASVDEIVPSADGRKLAVAYSVGNESIERAGCLDLATGVFTPMDIGMEDVDDDEIVISDDDERIAVAVIDASSNDNARVYIARTSDGAAERVDPGGAVADPDVRGLSFQPGGQTLAFRGNFDVADADDLFLATFEDGPVNLTSFVGNAQVRTYSWAPSAGAASGHLAFTADALTEDAMLVDVATRTIVATLGVPDPTDDLEGVAFSADGRFMLVEAESDTAGSNHLLYAFPVDLSTAALVELGPCARGTLRDGAEEGVIPTTDGAFSRIARPAGSAALVWTRLVAGTDSHEFVLGSADLPGVTSTLPASAQPGSFDQVQGFAVRGDAPTIPVAGGR